MFRPAIPSIAGREMIGDIRSTLYGIAGGFAKFQIAGWCLGMHLTTGRYGCFNFHRDLSTRISIIASRAKLSPYGLFHRTSGVV